MHFSKRTRPARLLVLVLAASLVFGALPFGARAVSPLPAGPLTVGAPDTWRGWADDPAPIPFWSTGDPSSFTLEDGGTVYYASCIQHTVQNPQDNSTYTRDATLSISAAQNRDRLKVALCYVLRSETLDGLTTSGLTLEQFNNLFGFGTGVNPPALTADIDRERLMALLIWYYASGLDTTSARAYINRQSGFVYEHYKLAIAVTMQIDAFLDTAVPADPKPVFAPAFTQTGAGTGTVSLNCTGFIAKAARIKVEWDNAGVTVKNGAAAVSSGDILPVSAFPLSLDAEFPDDGRGWTFTFTDMSTNYPLVSTLVGETFKAPADDHQRLLLAACDFAPASAALPVTTSQVNVPRPPKGRDPTPTPTPSASPSPSPTPELSQSPAPEPSPSPEEIAPPPSFSPPPSEQPKYPPPPAAPIDPESIDPSDPPRYSEEIPPDVIPLGWRPVERSDEEGLEYWTLEPIPISELPLSELPMTGGASVVWAILAGCCLLAAGVLTARRFGERSRPFGR